MKILQGIKTNKYIHQILTSCEELTDIVKPENIKVMVLQPTTFPYISIRRTALETSYNKDVATEDVVTIEIIVVDDDYARCVEIAQKIRELIDNKVYKNSEDNLLFSMIRFFDCVEDTVDDVFVQDMSFQIHVQNISDFLDD